MGRDFRESVHKDGGSSFGISFMRSENRSDFMIFIVIGEDGVTPITSDSDISFISNSRIRDMDKGIRGKVREVKSSRDKPIMDSLMRDFNIKDGIEGISGFSCRESKINGESQSESEDILGETNFRKVN